MDDIAQRLLEMKEQIENAKTEKAKLEGRLQGYLEELKTKFKCDSLEEAEKKLKVLKAQKEKAQQAIQTKMDDLENNYEW